MIEPSRRVVTVCSYLRIVYALLAYAPTIALGSKVNNSSLIKGC